MVFSSAGLCSLLLFTYCISGDIAYVTVCSRNTVVYGAIIVMVMSLFIFKEKLTRV